MGRNHYIIPIFVPHEGCPHDCAFCNQHSITGENQKFDSLEIIETIDTYLESISSSKNKDARIEISFFGGTFTGIERWKQNELLAIAYKYKTAGVIQKIRLSTRPDYIDEEILLNLTKYSVDIIELGAQSFDDEVLLRAERGHNSQQIITASKLIKRFGFSLGLQLMIGLPGATYEKDFYSAVEAAKLAPDVVRLYPSLVIKNTKMEQMYIRGEYIPYSLCECIEITKKIYAYFEVNDIKVIRVGLQPTEEITSGAELVAGPFHPALRELVEGAIFNDILKEVIIDLKDDVRLLVNNRDISKLYSGRKKRFKDIENIFKHQIRVFQSEEVKRNCLTVETRNRKIEVNIMKDISKVYSEERMR